MPDDSYAQTVANLRDYATNGYTHPENIKAGLLEACDLIEELLRQRDSAYRSINELLAEIDPMQLVINRYVAGWSLLRDEHDLPIAWMSYGKASEDIEPIVKRWLMIGIVV